MSTARPVDSVWLTLSLMRSWSQLTFIWATEMSSMVPQYLYINTTMVKRLVRAQRIQMTKISTRHIDSKTVRRTISRSSDQLLYEVK